MKLKLSFALLGASALLIGCQTGLSQQSGSKDLAPVILAVSGMT